MKAPLLPLCLVLVLAMQMPLRAEPVRVACVGDSITFGSGHAEPAKTSYPAILGELLGRSYEVRNFGVSGATLRKGGDKPYWNEAAFQAATEFAPNIVVLKLGTNDSKPHNWEGHEEEFLRDYTAMTEHFATLPTHPRILLCLPAPAVKDNFQIREAVLVKQRVMIADLASRRGLRVIDLHAALVGDPESLPDGIHPNEKGAAAMAKAVAKSIVQ